MSWTSVKKKCEWEQKDVKLGNTWRYESSDHRGKNWAWELTAVQSPGESSVHLSGAPKKRDPALRVYSDFKDGNDKSLKDEDQYDYKYVNKRRSCNKYEFIACKRCNKCDLKTSLGFSSYLVDVVITAVLLE